MSVFNDSDFNLPSNTALDQPQTPWYENINASGFSISNISSLAASAISTGSLSSSGNVSIGGNLTVSGTATTVNSTNVLISDSKIRLNSGNASDVSDSGFYVQYNSTYYASLLRKNGGGWILGKDYTGNPDNNWTGQTLDSLTLDGVKCNSVTSNSTDLVLNSATTNINLSGKTISNLLGLTFVGPSTSTISTTAGDLNFAAASQNYSFGAGSVSTTGSVNTGTLNATYVSGSTYVVTPLLKSTGNMSIQSVGGSIGFNSGNFTSVGTIGCGAITTSGTLTVPTITTSSGDLNLNSYSGNINCSGKAIINASYVTTSGLTTPTVTTSSGNLTLSSYTGTINLNNSALTGIYSITSVASDLSISSSSSNINFNNKNLINVGFLGSSVGQLVLGSYTGSIGFNSSNLVSINSITTPTITSPTTDLSISSATANINMNSKNLTSVSSIGSSSGTLTIASYSGTVNFNNTVIQNVVGMGINSLSGGSAAPFYCTSGSASNYCYMRTVNNLGASVDYGLDPNGSPYIRGVATPSAGTIAMSVSNGNAGYLMTINGAGVIDANGYTIGGVPLISSTTSYAIFTSSTSQSIASGNVQTSVNWTSNNITISGMTNTVGTGRSVGNRNLINNTSGSTQLWYVTFSAVVVSGSTGYNLWGWIDSENHLYDNDPVYYNANVVGQQMIYNSSVTGGVTCSGIISVPTGYYVKCFLSQTGTSSNFSTTTGLYQSTCQIYRIA